MFMSAVLSLSVTDRIALTLGGRPGRDEGSFPEAAAIAQNVMLMVFGLSVGMRENATSQGGQRRAFGDSEQ